MLFRSGLVAVHAYFTKSTPCIECEVDVKSGEKILLRTKTDENGRVKFTPPSKEFSAEVNAGMGHKAQISHVVEGEFKITPKGDEELGIWAKILSVFVIFIFFAVLYMYKKRRR